MKQQCAKCGNWVEGHEQTMLDMGKNVIKTIGGFLKSPIDSVKDVTKRAADRLNDADWLDLVLFHKLGVESLLEGLNGGFLYFKCPDCGYEWSLVHLTEEMVEQYAEQMQKEIRELSRKSDTEKAALISQWKLLLEKCDEEYDRLMLYTRLAFCQYKLGYNTSEVLETIDKALEIDEDDECTLELRAFVCREKSMTPMDRYEGLQVLSKDRQHLSFFTKKEIENCVADYEKDYAEHFLEIPAQQRKFLVVDNKLNYLSDSFMVLSLANLPDNVQFPQGHPQEKEMYVLHPYLQNKYIPISEYQLSLFREELDEMIVFFKGLGAKTIQITDTLSKENESQKNLEVKAEGKGEKKAVANGSAELSYDSENKEYLKLRNKFCTTHKTAHPVPPRVLDDLIWYNQRTEWKNIARGRMMADESAETSISLQKESFMSGAQKIQLKAEFETLIVKGGGQVDVDTSKMFKESMEHTWNVNVVYWPMLPTASESETDSELNSNLASNSTIKKNWILYVAAANIIVLLGVIISLL